MSVCFSETQVVTLLYHAHVAWCALFRELESIGRQLATIGDEVNRRYAADFDDMNEFDAIIAHLPEYMRLRLRRRRNVKRVARM